MRPVHIVFIVLIITMGLTIPSIVGNMTRPQLTDPIAQRIWAATHGNAILNDDATVKLVIEATYADSIIQNRKK
jgi:hypothetical protein